MAELPDAVAEYHRLLQDPKYQEFGWADKFHEDMRRRGLVDSGRLLSPVLRPYFVTKGQAQRASLLAARLWELLGRFETLTQHTPQLLNRLRMLPAEKVLAAIPCGYSRPGVTSRFNAVVHNGSVTVRNFETCTGMGPAFADVLANMFLDLPLLREFARGGRKVTKLGTANRLLCSILQAWTQFGATGKPNAAILEFKHSAAQTSEGELIAGLFRKSGLLARTVTLEELEFVNGRLRAGDYAIDLVFRRIDTRDLVTRCELSHPLLNAYRHRAVCLVNGFQSEMWDRRASLELLTDPALKDGLSSSDCALLRNVIPWTRLVSARKTSYQDREIDLLTHLARHRESFVLQPNEISATTPAFTGADLTQSAWEGALRTALQAPYVVQERSPSISEEFPIFRYGRMEMQKLSVSFLSHVLNGSLGGGSAVLETLPASTAQVVALAPVLVIH